MAVECFLCAAEKMIIEFATIAEVTNAKIRIFMVNF
jgi:hypothetical protein